MGAALLIARLLLAAIFLVAGLAKLADRRGSRQAAADFGVPERLAGAFGLGLPLVELAVAALLLPTSTAVWAALGALALLVAFAAAIVAQLARGRAPDCNCFGAIHSEPVGRGTLVRNGVFAALAAFVVATGWSDPGSSAVAWLGDLDTSGVVATVAAALAVAALAGGAWLTRRLLRRIEALEAGQPAAHAHSHVHSHVHADHEHGLPVGAPAPAFDLPEAAGGRVTLGELISRELGILLVFTDPGCAPCEELLPRVRRWQEEWRGKLTIAVVSVGPLAEAREKAERHALELVLADSENGLYHALSGAGMPSAVLLARDGTVARPLAAGPNAIIQIVEGYEPIEVEWDEGLPVGTYLAPLEVIELDGSVTLLNDLTGAERLLLFWNPSCPFCRAMHADLLAWEETRPPDAPELVVVSSGTADETRAEGFRSRILLDENFTAGEALYATGTPTAVLVDAEARIASQLATGAEAVFDLARGAAVPA